MEVQITWKAVEVMFVGDLVGDHVPHVPEHLLAAWVGASYWLGGLFGHDVSK
jgi:hypothetical protein